VTTGLGALTLLPPQTGDKALSSKFAQGEVFTYAWEGVDLTGARTDEWETGDGHLDNSGHLVRDTITASNTGVKVNITSPQLRVWNDLSADGIDKWLIGKLGGGVSTAMATNEITDQPSFLLVGALALDASKHDLVKFKTLGAVNRTGLTTEVQLFNLT